MTFSALLSLQRLCLVVEFYDQIMSVPGDPLVRGYLMLCPLNFGICNPLSRQNTSASNVSLSTFDEMVDESALFKIILTLMAGKL